MDYLLQLKKIIHRNETMIPAPTKLSSMYNDSMRVMMSRRRERGFSLPLLGLFSAICYSSISLLSFVRSINSMPCSLRRFVTARFDDRLYRSSSFSTERSWSTEAYFSFWRYSRPRVSPKGEVCLGTPRALGAEGGGAI